MFRIACISLGYLIGCIQSAYVVGRLFKVDIRKKGSGNLGTTNALRVLGKRAGALTFTCDVLKSVVAFFICRTIFKDYGIIVGVYGSVGAVLGHDFPFYLKFKGGKGIAAMIGMVLSFWGLPTIIPFGVGIAGLFTNHVSVGSILFVISIPIVLFFTGYPTEIIVVTILLAVLAIYRHKSNIVRLKNRNENYIFTKKENMKETN